MARTRKACHSSRQEINVPLVQCLAHETELAVVGVTKTCREECNVPPDATHQDFDTEFLADLG